jgi:hypothetical protein
MSVGTAAAETLRAAATDDAMESRLSGFLLRAIDAYDSHNGRGPTVPELAVDLGITPDFGHSNLVMRLQHELSLGHIAEYRGRIRLTRAGRDLVDPPNSGSPPSSQ